VSQVKVIPLGGCGEIGKNMTVVEQGDDIIVVDAGLSFPTDDMHGVDIVIPDFSYLTANRDRVRGILLTHAHEDHVGALPYILEEMQVPVYGSRLTIELVKRKLLERFNERDLDLRVFEKETAFVLGSFEIEPIFVTHSLPDAYAFAIWTVNGIIIFTGDFKFDFTPIDGRLSEISRFGELGDEGVALLLCDSTNAEVPGWSPSERSITGSLKRAFQEAPGRILLTTFASSLHRLQQVFTVAKETGRKVAIAGRRMDINTQIAGDGGFLKIPNDTYIRLNDIDRYDDDRVVILTTGSQGEPLAALSRMANEEYPKMAIKPGDTVIYSARPIPGNEAGIYQTINRIFRQGATVLYGPESNLHVSGHAYREEMKMMVNLTRPHYIAPVHGEPRHQYHMGKLCVEMGYGEESIIMMENGSQLVLEKDGAFFAESVVCGRVLVDGSGQAGVTDEVLRDRRNLANDGVVFVNVAMDSDAGKIVGTPEIVGKGVVALDGEVEELKEVLVDLLTSYSHAELHDRALVHQQISDVTRKFLRRAINRRPLVVATVVDV
jgi:ribonuclease J